MKDFAFGRLAVQLIVAVALALAFSSTEAWACGCSCTSDEDCHGGSLCNPATGRCERPTNDCACDADCDDGVFCNGAERCDIFAGCVASCPVDCSAGDDFCGTGVCDEESRSCVVAPLCDEQCERCDPEGCVSLCGNPWGSESDTINTTDALFTLRAALDLEQCDACVCDVDGNGTVTCTDTLMMLRHIVGLGDIFVCSPSAGPDETATTTTLPMF